MGWEAREEEERVERQEEVATQRKTERLRNTLRDTAS